MRKSAVNFSRKSWSKSFNNGLAYHRFGFKCICTTISMQNTERFYKTLPEQLNLEYQWEVAISKKSYPLRYQMSRRWNLRFLTKKFQSGQNSTVWNLVLTLPLRILLKPSTLSFKKNTITAKILSQLKCLEERKKNGRSGLAFFSTDLWHIFGSIVGDKFGVMLRGKGPHKQEFANAIVHHTPSHDIHRPDWVQNRWRHKGSITVLPFFFSKLKSGDIITTGQYMSYQTFSNLQFRSLLKNSFHSIHIDSRDTSGAKIPFVFVYITRLVLMFRKASNIHF